MNSPAEVIYQFLLDEGLADDSGGAWPLHISFFPDLPHAALCIYDTAGEPDGRIMQGPKIEHPGIQVQIRTPIYPDGWAKARAIADAFDNQIKTVVAVDDDASYILHDISRRGTIIPVGVDEQDGQRRHYFTINAVVTYAAIDAVTEIARLLDDTDFVRVLDDTDFTRLLDETE